MSGSLRGIRDMVREGGVRRLLGLVRYGFSELYHEWRLGIRTLHYVTREELGYRDRQYHFYAASAYRDVMEALELAEVRPGQDVLLDYGSGMGRVLVIAGAKFDFRRIIGIEYSPELNERARANLRRARRKLRCEKIDVVLADAGEYAVPHDVTVAYLYNPFEGELLRRVLERLRQSVQQRPRRLRVIFKNPPMTEMVQCPWLRPVHVFSCATGHRCVIYETSNVPAAQPGPAAA